MDVKVITEPNFTILRFEEKDEIGSVEVIKNTCYNFIENIYIKENYRHKGYFRKIIEYLKQRGTLRCLPLPEHRDKFEHLGFKIYAQEGEDIYYQL